MGHASIAPNPQRTSWKARTRSPMTDDPARFWPCELMRRKDERSGCGSLDTWLRTHGILCCYDGYLQRQAFSEAKSWPCETGRPRRTIYIFGIGRLKTEVCNAKFWWKSPWVLSIGTPLPVYWVAQKSYLRWKICYSNFIIR